MSIFPPLTADMGDSRHPFALELMLHPDGGESGTFAVDPEPSGPPWRAWEEIDADEAAARGIYAPVHALSNGTPGSITRTTYAEVFRVGAGDPYCRGPCVTIRTLSYLRRRASMRKRCE